MNRRQFVSSSVTASLALLGADPASAFLDCDINRVYTDELRLGIERTFWFPLGPQDKEKIVYVLVAPWCPICHQLFKDALNGEIQFSLRAVPVEGLSFSDKVKIANVIFLKSSEAISDFFNPRRQPTNSDYDLAVLNDVQHTTTHALYGYLKASLSSRPDLVRTGLPFFVSNYQHDDESIGFYMRAGLQYVKSTQITSRIRAFDFWSFENSIDVYEAILARTMLPKSYLARPKEGEVSRARGLPLPGAFPYQCGLDGDLFIVDSAFEYGGKLWTASTPSSDGFIASSGPNAGRKILFFSEDEFDFLEA